VVGINVAYLPPGQTGAVAIGFAIPAPTVTDVVGQLLENGEARAAFLGVQPVPLTAEIVRQFGIEADRGVLVGRVVADSPAEEAGISAGDVITAIDGDPIDSVPDLQGALRRAGQDAEIELTVVSGGEERTVRAELTDRPGR
jgi:S1-C subfamily serine protease